MKITKKKFLQNLLAILNMLQSNNTLSNSNQTNFTLNMDINYKRYLNPYKIFPKKIIANLKIIIMKKVIIPKIKKMINFKEVNFK